MSEWVKRHALVTRLDWASDAPVTRHSHLNIRNVAVDGLTQRGFCGSRKCKMTRAIAADIAGSEVCILRGLRHMALAEDPDAVNKPLAAFLDRTLL